MLVSKIIHFFIGLAVAAPSWLDHDQPQYLTVTVQAQPQGPEPSIRPESCADGTRPNEVYIIGNPTGACGTNALKPCTTLEDGVGNLCNDTCVKPVNTTTGQPANMYGLFHPRPDGGFFILYNGTNCERDTMYLQYPAQSVGAGPVRYVQATNILPMEVSPFRSFRYYPSRDQATI